MAGPKSLQRPNSRSCCSSLLDFRFATLSLNTRLRRDFIVEFEAHVKCNEGG